MRQKKPSVPLNHSRDFDELVRTVALLRSSDGCPWDQSQTHSSLRKYLLEECYEVMECLDRGNISQLKEELGDVLLQVLLHSQIAQEDGTFNIDDVIHSTNNKLVTRHPHVFGDLKLSSAKEVENHWEQFKKGEDGQQRKSILEGVPREMPALAFSQEVQSRAASTGFDWDHIHEVMEKVQEELEELEEATIYSDKEHEFGDVVLALVSVGRKMGIDAEAAARKANQRFSRRFQTMERLSAENGTDFALLPLEDKQTLWKQAKELEQ